MRARRPRAIPRRGRTHPGIVRGTELSVDRQAQQVAVEAAAAVQVAGPQQDPAAQNVHATISSRSVRREVMGTRAIPPFCTGTVPSVPAVGGAQNEMMCVSAGNLAMRCTISRVLGVRPAAIGPAKLAYRPCTGLRPTRARPPIPFGTLRPDRAQPPGGRGQERADHVHQPCSFPAVLHTAGTASRRQALRRAAATDMTDQRRGPRLAMSAPPPVRQGLSAPGRSASDPGLRPSSPHPP